MDSNDKNISPVDPLPPSYLSAALMYCPGVHANSVHVICAGNVNARLNVMLESRAGLVVCLALLRGTFPWNIYSCANGHQLVFHADLVEHCLDVRYRLMSCLELTLLVHI
jgi:hypothetical protein